MNPIIDVPEPLLLGLHALVILAREPGVCMSARTIADGLGASEGHLAKVLQRLSRAGYLEAVHGPGGGYRMVKDPSDMNMLPLVELLGGAFEMRGCGFPGCHDKPCLISSLINELTSAITDYLKKRSLADLLSHYELEAGIRINVSLGDVEISSDSRSDSE